MVKVKICGITTLEDATAAIEFGADLLGFNFFAKSQRFVRPEVARKIIEAIRGRVRTVGVFVNESEGSLRSIVEQTGLDAVQLHGDETADEANAIGRELNIAVIKALRLGDAFSLADLDAFETSELLVDAYSKSEYGGTGRIANWEAAKSVAASGRKVYLAGGLNENNVTEAIRAVQPFGVDAASGVEAAPGRKDIVKLKAFIERAKSL